MFTITGTRIVGLTAVVCAIIVAPQAIAMPSTHSVNPTADVFERFAAAHTQPALGDRRSPDTRDVADVRQIALADRRSPDTIDIATGVSNELPIQGTHSVDPTADVFERFAAAHTQPALGDRRSPDTRDVADVRQIALADRRSPDTIDIATGVSNELPIQGTHSVNPTADVFERFAAAHTQPALGDRRSPDTRDVADVRQIALADRRSPDTIDIATGVSNELPIQGMTLTRLGQRGSFDWGDAGIGATAAALILGLIGGSMLLLHMRPHRRQPAQTT